MGEYNTINFEKDSSITLTTENEYSTMGLTSVKISSTGASGYCGYLINPTPTAGKIVKLTADVKTTNSTWKLEFMYYANNDWVGNSVTISSGESSPTVQIEIPSEATRIFCRLRQSVGSSGDIIYTDNWRLEEV